MTISEGFGRDGTRRVRPWSVTAVAAFAAFAAFAVWLLVSDPPVHLRQTTGDLVPLAFEALVVLLAVSCARRRRTRRARWAWILVALAFSLYLVGDGLWAVFELVQHRSPFPSAADGFYLAFYPILLAGLLMLPGPKRRRNEWKRLGLDVLTVTISGAMTVWYLVIGPTLAQRADMSLITVLSLAYPVGDLVLVFGIATVIMRGADITGSSAMRWMALGATTFVVADIGFAVASLAGRYTAGSWPDLGWLLALVCFVVAADVERDRPISIERRSPKIAASRVSVLPYLAIVSSFALLIQVAFSEAGATVRMLLILVLALTATVVARQVTAVRDGARLTDQLSLLATTDPLTALANRRHLLATADREFEEARLHDENLAVIFIDVDHFKAINDIHGHAIGDAVLVWLALQLRRVLRDEDLIGRFGGDEFVAVVPALGQEHVLSMASRLERCVAMTESPIQHGPETITLSLGVATSKGCADLDELLAHADAALYQAKREGRSRACLMDPGTVGPRPRSLDRNGDGRFVRLASPRD